MKNTVFLFVVGFLACSGPSLAPESNEYTEAHRPQFHFSPKANWMNDPNGMVWYEGEYHLFYQYYPDSTVWGPMHWGHAVSKDLVHWEHLPIALYPDSLGYIFSGSAVVDWNNTSGFGRDGKPPLVAIFTHHDPVRELAGFNDFEHQSVAYSNDRGRTWTRYEGNPVVPNPGIRDFRDPKVRWHDASQQWIMGLAAWDHVKFYGSPDLKNWRHLSDFGREWGTHAGVWECPDLFPIRVEGSTTEKWVLLQNINPGGPNGGSGTQYFIGDFDGKTFTLDSGFAPAVRPTPAVVPEGIVFEDFEKEYKNWTVSGAAFGSVPADGAYPRQSLLGGFTGKRMANSGLGGDAATGRLLSRPFVVEKPYLNFQIGGGAYPGRTAVNLLVGDSLVRTQTGANSGRLQWTAWELASLKGKTARLELVDVETGNMGYILADQFVFSDAPAKAEQERAVWLDYGRDNYAGVTWSDVPPSDGRTLFLGWMSNWDYAQVVPTHPWRSAMTAPRTLSLHPTAAGYRVFSAPVRELEVLRGRQFDIPAGRIVNTLELSHLTRIPSPVKEIEVELAWEEEKGTFGLELFNGKGEKLWLGYDPAAGQLIVNRAQSGQTDFKPGFERLAVAPYRPAGNRIRLHCLIDVASIEVFADNGACVMTETFFPTMELTGIRLFNAGGNVAVRQGKLCNLKRIW